MYKIAHLADTHIRNLKYHKEYRKVFEQIFAILKEEKPNYIVHCGDIAHTKTQISPEFVEMASFFFRGLSEIAPTIIILGNHDGNLKNSSRQDAITPIVEALGIPEIFLHKKSCELHLDGLTFNVLSVFDEDNWVKPTYPEKINIALYHGSVSGVKTDTGYVMEHGDHDISIFEGFDYVMLGDIHKTNQKLDEEGRVRYPGSTIQQNFGETDDKGFLLWEIESKDKFNVRHVSIPNPSPFFTLSLTPTGKLPKDIHVPKNARLRLSVDHNVSLNAVRKAADVAKQKFKPISISSVYKTSVRLSESGDITLQQEENLRDLQVQERIIKEFLEDFHVEREVLKKVISLNKKYHTLAEDDEDIIRNVRWSLKNLEWENLFSYGPNNSINFEKLNGVVGIFGKNFTGKSSIIDSFLWTLFNSTSKSFRKSYDIINQNKHTAQGNVQLQVGRKSFVIDRSSTKYSRPTKEGTEDAAKTDLNFGYFDSKKHSSIPSELSQNMNGDSRTETDKNIRKMFGSIDDFLLTSMASQRDSLTFVNAKSTDRKQILAKFLDLEIFDKKYKLANDDALDLRGALKKLEGRDFDKELEEVIAVAASNERTIKEYEARIDLLKLQKKELDKDISEVDIEIAKSPDIKILEEETVEAKIKELEANKTDSIISLQVEKKNVDLKKNKLNEVKDVLSKIDIDNIESKIQFNKELENQVAHLESWFKSALKDEEQISEKIQLLKEVPCGNEFPDCRFLTNANNAKSELPKLIEIRNTKSNEKQLLEEKRSSVDLEEILSDKRRYESLKSDKSTLATLIAKSELKIERLTNLIDSFDRDISSLMTDLEEYRKNKIEAKNLKVLHSTRARFQKELRDIVEELEQSQDELTELWKEHGSLEQKWTSLEDSKLELAQLREEYAAYDLYLKCMHSNGISYDIIKKKLPVINEQIAKILANVVDFEVFLQEDGKNLPIMIKHPKYPPRSLNGGSGAELALASMAIRLALTRISSLPVGDLFILDEPATSLDEENMEGFTRIIEMLRGQFKTIILISHLDALKDIVDTQIVIDRKEGYSCVNV